MTPLTVPSPWATASATPTTTTTSAFCAPSPGALKPGGRFVVDYGAVAEALLPAFQERAWMPVGDMLFLREGRYNHLAGRIETDYTLICDGKVEKRPWTQRVYTYLEFCRLLAAAGFTDPQG